MLLHNLDESWEPADLEKALDEVDALEQALRKQGHPVINIPIYDSDLAGRLKNYDPDFEANKAYLKKRSEGWSSQMATVYLHRVSNMCHRNSENQIVA